MAKLIGFTIFCLIASLRQTCAQVFLLDLASNVVGLGQFIDDINGKLSEEPHTMSDVMHAVVNMNAHIDDDLSDIMAILKDLPSIVYFAEKQYNLDIIVRKIGFIFESAVEYQQKIKANYIEDEKVYEEFERYGNEIDEAMNMLRYIILSKDTKRDLIQTFSTLDQTYESVCRSGMSHFQLLDNLLKTLRICTAQYFIARTLMYKFMDLHNSKPIYNERKNALMEKVQREYQDAVLEFKGIMANASREIWTCDLRKYTEDVRYQIHSADSDFPYSELQLFTKFLTSEINFGESVRCNTPCSEIHYITECKESLCDGMRLCPIELLSCRRRDREFHDSVAICKNNEKNAYARYLGYAPNTDDQLRDFYCDPNSGTLIRSYNTLRAGLFIHKECSDCECTCLENIFRISLDPVMSDFENNKTVTGAKLTVVNNTLYIQIQEATILPNGIMGEPKWKPLPTVTVKSIAIWTPASKIALTEVILPPDQVIVGLEFRSSKTHHNFRFVVDQLYLGVYIAKVNFSTGKVDHLSNSSSLSDENSELYLSNLDVPTKSERKNLPDSKPNQFLRFRTSSWKKDGGQTTIPFIDTQKLITKPTAPLSGVGLVHRGQKGYGGFLALKLFTYNSLSNIKDDFELSDTLINL